MTYVQLDAPRLLVGVALIGVAILLTRLERPA